MIIGVDFDNTIVCYDRAFYDAAVKQKLIPPGVPPDKESVRNYLREQGSEDKWTELQGYIYGPGMEWAPPFPGAIEFFKWCKDRGIELHIISHRTLHPFAGPKFDLHQSAKDWLSRHNFHDPAGIALPQHRVHFELTKQAKLARIKSSGCTHFIEDLPEFLAETNFPKDVKKILFDPNQRQKTQAEMTRVGSWKEIGKLFGDAAAKFDPAKGEASADHPEEPNRAIVEKLAAQAGLLGDFRLTPIEGTANNRVFRADFSNRAALLKLYFQHGEDLRDRLGAEFSFITFAWEKGIRSLPRPLAADQKHQLALYEYLDGRRLKSGDVGVVQVRQALEFYSNLNRHRDSAEAKLLSVASEACFSIAEHLQLIQNRIERLGGIETKDSMHRDVKSFANQELKPTWTKADSMIRKRLPQREVDQILAPNELCLSPSDFGFHNALESNDGRIKFLDFEYAGWDDPAKLVCDFFCQPAVPVPMEHYAFFSEGVAAALAQPEKHLERMSLLLPVYRLKWCSIMLNEFLPAGAARRRFARPGLDPAARQRTQLEKARALLKETIRTGELSAS